MFTPILIVLSMTVTVSLLAILWYRKTSFKLSELEEAKLSDTTPYERIDTNTTMRLNSLKDDLVMSILIAVLSGLVSGWLGYVHYITR